MMVDAPLTCRLSIRFSRSRRCQTILSERAWFVGKNDWRRCRLVALGVMSEISRWQIASPLMESVRDTRLGQILISARDSSGKFNGLSTCSSILRSVVYSASS
jgi:hypothetical protein